MVNQKTRQFKDIFERLKLNFVATLHVQGGRKEVKKVITLFDAKISLNCYF